MLGFSRSRARVAGVVLAATSLVMTTAAACDKAAPEAPPLINNYVSAIQVLGEVASQEVVNQQLGQGADDGPQSEVDESATVINGGSVQEAISSDDPFTKLRIGMEPLGSANSSASPGSSTPTTAATASGVPSKGYHEITLKEESTEITAVVTITQDLPGQQFVFYFAVVDKAGKQGKLAKQTVDALEVGTGEVQVSISWDVDSDVDLHVEDPNGDEVYWKNEVIDSGGELDLDSNADCELDHKRNENITWSKAPAGTYVVRVDYYRSCDVAKTNYVVTVRVNGQPTKTYTGTLTGGGDEGHEGSGDQVTTFKVVTAEPSATG
jgi:hypothetical protein